MCARTRCPRLVTPRKATPSTGRAADWTVGLLKFLSVDVSILWSDFRQLSRIVPFHHHRAQRICSTAGKHAFNRK